jgi:hypothetical protein
LIPRRAGYVAAMIEERDITDPDPDQQDPESGPASDEDESTGDAELDSQVESLKVHGDQLEEQIDDVKGDWEAKQNDARVPGAVPEEEPAQSVQSERGESAGDAGQ